MKLKYKFRLILDETWSFGVLGRAGRGITEHQNVDAVEVDMIIGSMAGGLASAGGFCAGSDEVVEHQRLSAAAYTFSAALPAMSAVTASETISMLQTQPDNIVSLRENIKVMWSQLDPRSEYMECTSASDNPIMLMVLKPEFVQSRRLSREDEQNLLQDIVDEVSISSVSRIQERLFTDNPAVSSSGHLAYEAKNSITWHSWLQDRSFPAATCNQNLSDEWINKERDRKGGNHHQTRDHQDCIEEEVI